MARVVVIGAGLGGLAAAARLAAARHRVTVLERSDVLGGKLGVVERRTEAGTFRFDTGPSLLTWPQVFTDLFADTGAPLASVLTLSPLDPIAQYRFADGSSITTTSDLDAQAARFDTAFGLGTGAAWTALVQRGERIWAAVSDPVLGRSFGVTAAARRLARMGDLRAVAPGRSLRSIGRRYLTDPRQRMMLDRYATYTGSDPRLAPAALAVIPYLEHAHGGWYVEGGLRRLVDAIADRARERGAQIRTGAEVDAVTTAADRVTGVRLTDGSRVDADIVVADADASAVYGRLLRARPVPVPPVDSLAGFVVLLGVRGHTPDLAHHTVLFGQDSYDAEFDAVFGRPGRPVSDPVVYVSAPHDPAAAPSGHEAWFVLVNAPRHGRDGEHGAVDWDRPGLASDYARHVLSLLDERGLPVRDRVMFTEVISPADLERRTAAPGGAIYGAALHGLRASMRRPANASRVRGLYLVGGSTHPGGGLPLVTLSARIVAGLVGPA